MTKSDKTAFSHDLSQRVSQMQSLYLQNYLNATNDSVILSVTCFIY